MWNTTPSNECNILHPLRQINSVQEKCTTLKNTGAKFWVTHGHLRGLTFEHFQKKLSPGRGWHLRDPKFRSWTNLTNNNTPSFQSNPIQLNCYPKDPHLPALHSRTQSNAIQQKYRAFNPMQFTSNAIHVISTQPKQPNLSKPCTCGTRRSSQTAILTQREPKSSNPLQSTKDASFAPMQSISNAIQSISITPRFVLPAEFWIPQLWLKCEDITRITIL